MFRRNETTPNGSPTVRSPGQNGTKQTLRGNARNLVKIGQEGHTSPSRTIN